MVIGVKVAGEVGGVGWEGSHQLFRHVSGGEWVE